MVAVMCPFVTMHCVTADRQTNGQTDRQTTVSFMPILADHTACSTIG